MSNQIRFPKNIDEMLAAADEIGVRIVAGWTVGIPKAKAIEYWKTYNSHPNAGFYEFDGKAVITHGDSKLTLTMQEAQAIRDLIEAKYGPF